MGEIGRGPFKGVSMQEAVQQHRCSSDGLMNWSTEALRQGNDVKSHSAVRFKSKRTIKRLAGDKIFCLEILESWEIGRCTF